MLFRGFVKTKNKKCIEKFKGRTDLMTLEQAQELDEYAGILAKDTVLIDIDDADQAEILMDIVEEKQLNCKVVCTTRGKHFFFKNNGSFTGCKTGAKLACGLTADIKVGLKDSYAICKFAGQERFVEWDSETIDEAPKWLLPVKSSFDFLNMKEGEGRDSALFSYILCLQSAGIAKNDCITAIKIINDHLLKDKMSDADIERITRPEAFDMPVFFKDGTFLFDAFARYMESEHHIKRIDSQLHIYKDGYYQADLAEIENAMIRHIPTLSRAKRKEVLDYLDIMIREETEVTGCRWVAFKNGLLNIETDQFEPFTPDVVVTNLIPHDYNASAYDELMDKTLDKISCEDETVRALLEEMAGACLFRSNNLAGGKAFILTGGGSNGKSTYLNVIKAMLGKQNISVLDMKKLNDRFSTVMMYNKLANIGDDISDNWIDDTSEFKKIVTGESIDCEQKGQPKFNFEPKLKLIFSANSLARMGRGRDSSAIIRRLVIIPFNAQFKSTDADFVPFIGEKLKEVQAIQYLINLAVAGLKRVLASNAYSSNERLEKELREFEETNNPILGFFNETEKGNIENQPTKDVYRDYTEYCINTGITPMAQGEFSKQVKKHYNVNIVDKKINGTKYRLFVGV